MKSGERLTLAGTSLDGPGTGRERRGKLNQAKFFQLATAKFEERSRVIPGEACPRTSSTEDLESIVK